MFAYSQYNCVKLVHGGKDFFSLLKQLIDEARHSIHIQTYIFDSDETGTAIANALKAAAKRKVDVYLVADGYASQHLAKTTVKELEDAGVHFRFFKTLFTSKRFYFGRRLHHKVVVIDGMKSLVGGINISNKYNDYDGKPPWFDLALYVEGQISEELFRICTRIWSRQRKKKPGVTIKPDLATRDSQKKYYPVRVRQNDWVKNKQEIGQTYYQFFKTAKESLTIVCSYFLPGTRLRRQLKRAARRGVKVTIVLAGISDVPVAKYAERYLYRWMLRNGIRIYEYQKTILHAKMAIVDKQKTTLGSYNINNISELASIELNLEVDSPEFSKEVLKDIQKTIDRDCLSVNSFTYTTKLFSIKQFLQWGAFQFVRMVLTLSTFYFRREK